MNGIFYREDLGYMTYLGMCIKESMRLTPPVSGTNRRIEQDVTLADGTTVPEGKAMYCRVTIKAVIHLHVFMSVTVENRKSSIFY